MVGIIKTLADDPLKKPIKEETTDQSPSKYMKTVELEKTIYRIRNLLQMSYGKLGAVILNENVSSGDGSLEIMIPGHRINVIIMICRINNIDTVELLGERAMIYVNKIVKIIHHCGERWSGSVNRNESDIYMITWKMPDAEEGDHEKNELIQLTKTEYADKSLIAAVKIISEIRRSGDI